MAHGVRRHPLTAEASLIPRMVHLEFLVDRIAQGQVVLGVLGLLSFRTCSALIHSSATDGM
jgi:hypothetical protein